MCELSDKQQALQELARDFAQREIRPIARDLDLEPELERRFPWDVVDRASELGLRTLALPPDEGGVGLDPVTVCLVFEELAYGDIGFATTLEQTWRLTSLLTLSESNRPTLLPRFREHHRQLLTHAPASGNGSQSVTARPASDHLLLEGKARRVIAGGVAGLVFVEALEPEGWTSLFAVQPDRAGFRVERLVDKAGRHLEPTGDITLDRYSVTESDRIGEAGQAPALLADLDRRGAPVTAVGAVAVARSAYDLAVDWARRRIQGGKVIAEHPAVAMKLGDMYVSLEASRTIALRAAWALDHYPQSAESLGLAAKVLSAQTAHRVCYDAMQIWGGMGFMTKGGLEKFTRDAFAYLSEQEVDTARERAGRLACGPLIQR